MAEYPAETRMQLRRLIGDAVEPYTFDDATIDEWLTETDGDVRSAASHYWYQKAVSYSESVDITEAGSSRKNSDLFKHAIELAKQYDDDDDDGGAEVTPSTTRRIVRR